MMNRNQIRTPKTRLSLDAGTHGSSLLSVFFLFVNRKRFIFLHFLTERNIVFMVEKCTISKERWYNANQTISHGTMKLWVKLFNLNLFFFRLLFSAWLIAVHKWREMSYKDVYGTLVHYSYILFIYGLTKHIGSVYMGKMKIWWWLFVELFTVRHKEKEPKSRQYFHHTLKMKTIVTWKDKTNLNKMLNCKQRVP